MFVQRFEQGDAAPMPGDAFRAVFAPRADRREPQHGYWHISADDGGTADIYATEEGPPPQHHQRRATRREHQTKTGPEGPEFSLICARRSCWRDFPRSYVLLVELRGFEPLTPSMRTRCATSLRHSPPPANRLRSHPAYTGRAGSKANRSPAPTANPPPARHPSPTEDPFNCPGNQGIPDAPTPHLPRTRVDQPAHRRAWR